MKYSNKEFLKDPYEWAVKYTPAHREPERRIRQYFAVIKEMARVTESKIHLSAIDEIENFAVQYKINFDSLRKR